MFDMKQTLEALAVERMMFHSEADFQHALAVKIAQLYPSAAIRLEVPLVIDQTRIHLDIRVTIEEEIIAIELKYATTKLSAIHNQESYDLRDQSADDLVRYGFCKDIERLEQAIDHKHCSVGYAVILSNYSSFWKYWSPGEGKQTNDRDFRIHEERALHGELKWGLNTNSKFVPNPLYFRGHYSLNWNKYSSVSDLKNGLFRYAVVRISTASESESETENR